MIDPIPGWGWEVREAGILLTPPKSHGGASIRYVERMRPLRHLLDVVASLPLPPGYVHEETSAIEPYTTDEGEYGALVKLRGQVEGRPLHRVIACTYVDDFHSLVGGVARDPGLAPLVEQATRDLALADRHGFGLRRRRYLHARPRGWRGTLLAPYLAIYVTREPGSVLHVLPAAPLGEEEVVRSLFSSMGVRPDEVLPDPETLAVAEGLTGKVWELPVADKLVLVAALADDRYAYPMTMSTTLALRPTAMAALAEVTGSVSPLPRPRAASARPSEQKTLSMWTE
jgi:hypothetical protein